VSRRKGGGGGELKRRTSLNKLFLIFSINIMKQMGTSAAVHRWPPKIFCGGGELSFSGSRQKLNFQSFNGSQFILFYFRLDHHSKIPPWEKSIDELNPKVLII
jgi:hypothetical protein